MDEVKVIKDTLDYIVSTIRKKPKAFFNGDFSMVSNNIVGTPWCTIVEIPTDTGVEVAIRVTAPCRNMNTPYLNIRFAHATYVSQPNPTKVITGKPVRSWINLEDSYLLLFIEPVDYYNDRARLKDVDPIPWLIEECHKFSSNAKRLESQLSDKRVNELEPPPKFDSCNRIDEICNIMKGKY